MDSNAFFAVLLMFVGLAILTAEIFVPSGGLLGLITFISLTVSVVFAYRAWGETHTSVFATFCVLLFLLVPTVIGIGFSILPRTSIGKKVMLEAPESQHLKPFHKESSRFERSVGRFGVAATMLNPSGFVSLDGERLHAVSEGLVIDSGTSVEIIGVQGNRVVVRPGEPPANVSSDSNSSSSHPSSQLDFDFPPVS